MSGDGRRRRPLGPLGDYCSDLEEELTQARALLEEMRPYVPQDRRPGSLFRRCGAILWRARQQLSPPIHEMHDVGCARLERRGECDCSRASAPAQTAPRTTALLCYEGDCAKMTGRARPCPVHDAPAQAEEPTDFPSTIRKGKEWQQRAESAEAELAVLRGRGTPSGHVVSLEAALQSAESTIAAVADITKGWYEYVVYISSYDALMRIRDLLRARKGGGNG